MAHCTRSASRSTQGMRNLQRPRPLHPRFGSVAVPSPLGNLVHGTSLSYRHQAVPAEFGAFINERGAVQIDNICNLLKESGARMENAFKGELDRIFSLLRDACRDDGLSDAERMKILEIVLLRAAGWNLNNGPAEDSSHNFRRADSVDLRDSTAGQLSRPRPRRAIEPTSRAPPQEPRQPPRSVGSNRD
ncbi:hypothetical protein V5799_031435 [Amblyomma americanum]|uniref:MIF4G domain-containing protein n=1 Tax=Amblyomma americanum TaxID=6943 RepID=A0AAQ4EKU5_AMBAM